MRAEGGAWREMDAAALLIDRPGTTPATFGPGVIIVMERPGDAASPAWILCDIDLACRRRLTGAVRITPPQKALGAPQVSRATGILGVVNGIGVDLLSSRERGRVGLSAGETIPLRIRLHEDPPYPTGGLDPRDDRIPLEKGVWTRSLKPIDLADDVARLAPLAW